MDQQPKKNKKFEWTYIETIFCVSAVLIVFMPLLLTRDAGWASFKETGPIGDTIGGTTAPFVGLLSAWLVYKALKAQINANELILDQFEFQKKDERNNKQMQYITDQIKILRDDIKEFKFYEPWPNTDSGMVYNGIDGIYQMVAHYSMTSYHDKDIELTDYQDLRELKGFLSTISYLLKLTEALDEEDKLNLNRVLYDTYRNRLYPTLFQYRLDRLAFKKKCDSCEFRHGIPEYIYSIYDSINNKLSLKG